jgi:hypothetical protein
MSDSENFVTTNNVTYVEDITYYFYVTEIKEITIEVPHEKNKRDEECIQNFVVVPPENPRILWITLRWIFGRQVMDTDFDKHC